LDYFGERRSIRPPRTIDKERTWLFYRRTFLAGKGLGRFYFLRRIMTKRNLFLIATCLTVGLSIGGTPQAQVNCNAQQIGSVEYGNCSNGLSGNSQQIGDIEYFNLNDGTSGTRQSIGDIDYYNSNNPALSGHRQQVGDMEYSQWDDGVSGTHQRIGDIEYNNFSDGTACTSQVIGGFTYTNCN